MAVAICSALAVLLMREVLLLGMIHSRLGVKLLSYAAINGFYLLWAIRAGSSLTGDESVAVLRSPFLWLTTMLMHAALAYLWYWLRRNRIAAENLWVITLIPSPILLLCMVVASRHFGLGPLIGWLWVGCVAVGAAAFQRHYRGWEDSEFAAEFAELTNWGGFSVLPLIGLLQNALPAVLDGSGG